jgi:hypothetical protein
MPKSDQRVDDLHSSRLTLLQVQLFSLCIAKVNSHITDDPEKVLTPPIGSAQVHEVALKYFTYPLLYSQRVNLFDLIPLNTCFAHSA